MDSTAELWDAYNGELNKIEGMILKRGEPIPKGMFHLVSDVLVKHKDGSFLIMQRDLKKHYGGLWEATAGGSAKQGETAYQCAVRELYEETGIISGNLVKVGTVVTIDTIYVEFLCVTDWDKTKVSLQEGETIDYMWIDQGKLLNMKGDKLVTERMQYFISELR